METQSTQLSCPDEGQWESLLQGALSESAQEELGSHLEGCARCQQILDELATAHGRWEGAEYLGEGPLPPDSNLRRVLDAVRAGGRLIAIDSPATSPLDSDATGVVSAGLSASVAGRFRILRPYARGGLGQISVAYDEELDREVALKEIQPQHADCTDSRRRFVLEAEVTGRLEHPGIVPVYGMGTHADGRPYYAMRFIQGESLKAAIQSFHANQTGGIDLEGSPELNDLLGRFLGVCDAIAYAHSRGILHRDLKPGNIMLGEFGETLIVDWGLAKRFDKPGQDLDDDLISRMTREIRAGQTLLGSAVGTPQYMSPEQATGDLGDLGPPTDVYSLGAILYEIITGHPPHEGRDTMECLRAAAENQIVPTIHSGELVGIAYRCMSTRPEDRCQNVRDVSNMVRQYLSHRESILLANMADQELQHARTTGEYNDYAKARFRFEEALKLWERNERARAGLKAVEVACALEREDYDFAGSFLNPHDPSDDQWRGEIARAREERDTRRRHLEVAKRAGRVLIIMLFLVVSSAAVWINEERAVAVDARNDAIAARQEAETARDIAVEAKEAETRLRAAAEKALERERIALKQEAEQRRLADSWRKDAQAERSLRLEAERERQLALAAFKVVEEELVEKRNIEVRLREQVAAQAVVETLNAAIIEELSAQLAQLKMRLETNDEATKK